MRATWKWSGAQGLSFTAVSAAPAPKAMGEAAFARSPPSMIIPSFPAPSSNMNVEDGVKTRAAVTRIYFESIRRSTDSAAVFP